jgi:hypothetical protein
LKIEKDKSQPHLFIYFVIAILSIIV